MGTWSSHTSVGNIVSSIVASRVLELGWGWSFVVPGLLIICVGILVYLFLLVSPEDMGFENSASEIEMNVETDGAENVQKLEAEEAKLLDPDNSDSSSAVGFFEAWILPGVAAFASCLFSLSWLLTLFSIGCPSTLAVAGFHLSKKSAGILSTIFDIGGVLGGVMAGLISDIIEARAVTSIIFLFQSIPMLVLYRVYGSLSMLMNIALMFPSGLLVNGPYALIITAVTADLGTQTLNQGNSRALATVTAIIDGTGSVGATVGPILAGHISTWGWNSVFFMLILSVFLADLFLARVARTEIKIR